MHPCDYRTMIRFIQPLRGLVAANAIDGPSDGGDHELRLLNLNIVKMRPLPIR
jgi:hypothetical protein